MVDQITTLLGVEGRALARFTVRSELKLLVLASCREMLAAKNQITLVGVGVGSGPFALDHWALGSWAGPVWPGPGTLALGLGLWAWAHFFGCFTDRRASALRSCEEPQDSGVQKILIASAGCDHLRTGRLPGGSSSLQLRLTSSGKFLKRPSS